MSYWDEKTRRFQKFVTVVHNVIETSSTMDSNDQLREDRCVRKMTYKPSNLGQSDLFWFYQNSSVAEMSVGMCMHDCKSLRV